MALLTVPRTRGRHAAKTPFWRQIGIGRARHDLTAQPLVSAPTPEPSMGEAPAPAPVVSAEQAREAVERLFPAGADGLYPLDWRYGTRWTTAQVDPGLVVDAARNVVLAYAAALDAPFVQETVEDRLHMRVSRAVDGVQVTVWADITPEPQEQLALPAAEPAAPELPIEREVRCVLDDTAVFDPITDDMDDPRQEHPDAAPDGEVVEEPTSPDHIATPDPVAVADEPAEEQAAGDDTPAADEPDTEPEDDDTPATDGEDTPSTKAEEDEDTSEDSEQEAAA